MDPKGEELAAVIAEIRDRVRSRSLNGSSGDPDLMPLLHARDAAEAKVASIGTVNPRPPGFVNSIAQSMKRLVARALDWHVREQVEFNRAVMNCVQATLDILNEYNRSGAGPREAARQLADMRTRWAEWHVHWEQTLSGTEIQFLRTVSELQASFNHRVTLLEAHYREQIQLQHGNFEAALARTAEGIQKRLWEDIGSLQNRYDTQHQAVLRQYETIIHNELRLLRQKASLANPPGPTAPTTTPAETFQIDWLKFAEKFRGSEAAILERQRMYAARFRGHAPVLDIGCGRGEMLAVLRDAGIGARGIDLYDDDIALCRSKGLDVEQVDLFTYLAALPDASLGGAVCCQVVEHLPPPRVLEMIRLLREKLRPGALVAIETPNPECLAIFATHFYIDPTHRHPIPPSLLCFYLEESGLGRIEVERLSPAIESMPALAELPETFRNQFFGALDYVVFATRLG
jgi:2-polyprenyl-3-methyl-5-hydroxy-6-metoxy-1,4-benzoquinol methylase